MSREVRAKVDVADGGVKQAVQVTSSCRSCSTLSSRKLRHRPHHHRHRRRRRRRQWVWNGRRRPCSWTGVSDRPQRRTVCRRPELPSRAESTVTTGDAEQ